MNSSKVQTKTNLLWKKYYCQRPIGLRNTLCMITHLKIFQQYFFTKVKLSTSLKIACSEGKGDLMQTQTSQQAFWVYRMLLSFACWQHTSLYMARPHFCHYSCPSSWNIKVIVLKMSLIYPLKQTYKTTHNTRNMLTSYLFFALRYTLLITETLNGIMLWLMGLWEQ